MKNVIELKFRLIILYCKCNINTSMQIHTTQNLLFHKFSKRYFHFCVFSLLRRCETPPSPPASDPVGIENCKQLFSLLLAFTIQKIATHNTDIISAVCVAFFWVVNASRNEKSCLQFLIPTAVFNMLLKEYFVHSKLLPLHFS